MQYLCWLNLVDYFWYTSAVRIFCQYSISASGIRLACQSQLYYQSMSCRRLTKIWTLEFLDLKCLDSSEKSEIILFSPQVHHAVCAKWHSENSVLYRSVLNSISIPDSRPGNSWGTNKNAAEELPRYQDNAPHLKNVSQYPLHFIKKKKKRHLLLVLSGHYCNSFRLNG